MEYLKRNLTLIKAQVSSVNSVRSLGVIMVVEEISASLIFNGNLTSALSIWVGENPHSSATRTVEMQLVFQIEEPKRNRRLVILKALTVQLTNVPPKSSAKLCCKNW